MIKNGTLLQNRYRVIQQVGKGGMGEVYLAMDERFQSRVAIKRTFFNDTEMCKAFRREARLLNHLHHAALPKVSDHFTEGDGQFLVMEFVEGFDFAELLARRKVPLPVNDVLRWADELLDALDYLHTHEPPIVHRDIKPPNIKLTPRGKVMLLDFGLAKGTPTQTASGTAASSVFGYSLNFAPLEQMQGSGTDPRSDLYSLAATLYSLLTGVRPPDALTRASAAIKEQPDPLRPAHLVQAQVPVAISQILQRAMSQNAALRHASAAELRAALRRAASNDAATPQDASLQSAIESVLPQSLLTPDMATSVKSSKPLQGARRTAAQEVLQAVSHSQSPRHSSPLSAEAATTIDTPRRPHFSNSYTVVAHAESTRKGAKSKTLILVACLLVVCVAAVPYLLKRTSSASVPATVDNTQEQTSAPLYQQTNPGEVKSNATGNAASDSSRSLPDTNVPAQSMPARSASEPSSDSKVDTEVSAPVTDGQSAKGSSQTPDGATMGTSASSTGRPALVIQNPAPAVRPADEARRAEESRREQPQYRPDYNNGPPPGPIYPPPGGDRRPPPPDGRRPPPNFRPLRP